MRKGISLHWLMLPALVAYGLLVEPSSGDRALPCIWKLLFGVACPGCGLSRADALLVRGDLRAALELNWLIVPVWLLAVKSFADRVVNALSQRR